MRRGGIDVIILDLAMPTISGWDLLAIRAGDAALRRVPVIVVSAVADLVDDGTLQREASAVLCKPFEPAVLQGIVASCLANANREEQHASS
jgi:CheY-like chemotaxis protein